MRVTSRRLGRALLALGALVAGIAPPGIARATSPDLSLPVMPGSLFEGMAAAQLLTPTAVGGAQDTRALAPVWGEIDLGGLWRYQADPEGRGEAAGWAGAGFDDSGWATMPVPSNFSREDATLEDHFAPVWFRTTFTVPASWGDRRLRLRFDGVDYFARVFVNGQALAHGGEHEGYFAPFDFDLSGVAHPGANTLAVEVTNPFDYGQVEKGLPDLYPILGEKVWIKGILNFHDTRPGDSLGGPIMQTRGTGGIVQAVRLISDGGVDLRWVFLTPTLAEDGAASLTWDAVLENKTGAPLAVTVNASVRGATFDSDALGEAVAVTLPPGMSRLSRTIPIPEARLWCLWDQDPLCAPDLYAFTATVHDGSRALDAFEDRFGIRSVEFHEIGREPWIFRFNGRRSFLRGANAITTQWMAEADRPLHEADAALARGAGMNALRVHAHIGDPELYEVMDEAGIALLQDFTLQWAYSVCDHERLSGDPHLTSNVEVMERMLAEMIYLLYNHPSVALWILHNEPLYGFVADYTSEDGLGDPQAPDACPAAPYSQTSPQPLLLDASLGSALDLGHLRPVATAIEATRPIHTASGDGDAHTYSGWYGGLYTDLWDAAPGMITEYGAEAAPFRGEAFMAEEPLLEPPGWPPATDEERHVYRIHDAQLQNYGMYIGRAHRAYAHYADWAFASQLYQAALLKYGGEHLRALRYDPTGVAVLFTFQNWWESFTWGIIDADRTPHVAQRWLGESFAPVATFIHAPSNVYEWGDALSFELHAVNDVHLDRAVRLSAELWEESDSFYIRGDPEAWTDFGVLGEDPPTFGPPVEALTVTRGHGRAVGSEPVARFTAADTLPADGHLIYDLPVSLAERAGAGHFTWRLTLADAASGEVITRGWHHFVVVEDAEALVASVPPGIHPMPRFTLALEVDVPGPASVKVTRRYAEEVALEGELAGSFQLAGLVPGFYDVTATFEGQARSGAVHLVEDASLRLSFAPAATPTATPGATPATPPQEATAPPPSPTPPAAAEGGCGCGPGAGAPPGALALLALMWAVGRGGGAPKDP